MDNKQNEELQSRREFFKKAAKAAMPVVGAVVLSSLPLQQIHATGCTAGCAGDCQGSCSGVCRNSCYSTCYGRYEK